LKYFFSGLFALLIGIAMALPAAVPTQADSGKNNPVPRIKKQALMIKVDKTVEVSQPVTITVFSKHSHETIAGAPVYAIKTGNRVGPAGTDNYTTLTSEVEALIESDGTLIGTTGSNGTVSAVLSEAGRYLLLATKDGYVPGFARLQVKQITEDEQKLRLTLQAPASSPAGQQITIKVTNGSSGQAVDNATISAFKTPNELPPIIRPAPQPVENGTATQMIIKQQAPIVLDTEQEDTLTGRLGKREIVLGSSNSAGEVFYTFTDPGMYMLLVRKNGYLPGARRINIQSDTALKSLDVKAVINTAADQPTTIQVTEKSSSQPVEGAAVYSLKVETNRNVKQMPPTANNIKTQVAWAWNDAARVRENGVLVGNTDSAGQVAYSFPSSGQYVLAAFKDGYRAAITRAGYFPPVSATTGANVTSTVPVTTITTTE